MPTPRFTRELRFANEASRMRIQIWEHEGEKLHPCEFVGASLDQHRPMVTRYGDPRAGETQNTLIVEQGLAEATLTIRVLGVLDERPLRYCRQRHNLRVPLCVRVSLVGGLALFDGVMWVQKINESAAEAHEIILKGTPNA